jgi:pilus assembly protein CpaF
MEGDIITMQDIFQYDFSQGFDDWGNFRGELKATGLRPKFMSKLKDYGIDFPQGTFSTEG